MRPTNFNIQTVIDTLQGTTMTIDDALEQEYPGMEWADLINEDHVSIDNSIFLCPECGWWCEISEQSQSKTDSDEALCEDCAGNQDDDGEDDLD